MSSLRPLRQRSYETGEGEKRTVYEVDADDVAVPLCGATVKVTKAARSTAGAAKSAGDSDPWAGEARKVTQALRLSKPSKHGVVPVLSPIGSAPLHGNAGGTRYHPEI